MKPESQPSSLNIETIPAPAVNLVEREVELSVPTSGIESSPEAYEKSAELGSIASDLGITTTIPAPISDAPLIVDNATITPSPLIANDDDLIEKEWVDKAKKIVSETQNDPHLREKEVSKLQVDYIKKRYGRELGVAD